MEVLSFEPKLVYDDKYLTKPIQHTSTEERILKGNRMESYPFNVVNKIITVIFYEKTIMI